MGPCPGSAISEYESPSHGTPIAGLTTCSRKETRQRARPPLGQAYRRRGTPLAFAEVMYVSERTHHPVPPWDLGGDRGDHFPQSPVRSQGERHKASFEAESLPWETGGYHVSRRPLKGGRDRSDRTHVDLHACPLHPSLSPDSVQGKEKYPNRGT